MRRNHKRAILLQVSTNKAKLPRICQIASSHFERKHHLLILCPDSHSAEFIDRLLWSYPIDSFLPHAINLDTSQEMICISYGDNNPSKATAAFNLLGEPLQNSFFTTIYDFEDVSTSEKKLLSQKKLQTYKESGYSIASF